MRFFRTLFNDFVYNIGLILIGVSLIIFALPLLKFPLASENPGGLFVVNYLIAVGYLIIKRTLRKGEEGRHHTFLFLILFLISAYALNREMNVFDESVPWFSVVLVIICVNYVSFIFFDKMNSKLQFAVCLIAGLATVVFVYLAIYLIPIYWIGAIAFLALGISLHTFVPLLFCYHTIRLLRMTSIETKKYWVPFFIGMLVPILFVTGYSLAWNSNLKIVNKTYRYASITANNQLPAWIQVAQQMNRNSITRKILKTTLVYKVPSNENDLLWRMPITNFEPRKHDPLVVISTLFCGRLHMEENDQIKVLEAMYDARHQAQERLWSGDDLVTEKVTNHVQLFPGLRLSYSQMELTISHNAEYRQWFNKKEAIYSFYLPEGSVVTSLSLWIDGEEQKGMLTTKSKADSTYKTIVGREARDPSVVHWQEGNMVSVRVFPINGGETRKFKIGITAPLLFGNNRLSYQNIYFKGPDYSDAREEVTIECDGCINNVVGPIDFRKRERTLRKNGAYSPTWSVTIPDTRISDNTFSFNNHTYSVMPIEQHTENFPASAVYLDINSSWTMQECEKIYQLVKNKKVFVSTGEKTLTEVDANGRQELFETLITNEFSLFPFHKIGTEPSPVVISKSNLLSPTIDDLKNTVFLKQLEGYFRVHQNIRLFNLGNGLSPYLKSLKEFRVLQYDSGDELKLEKLLSENVFTKTVENDDQIPVYASGICLKRSPLKPGGTAPDHLMRLFAYNHILQRSGRTILSDTVDEQSVIKEAEEAYVVSPFSSLIVLETQKDYDRFGIKASENSLQNASLKSNGAVPEPHEWALIIVIAGICVYARFRFSYLIRTR